MRHVIPISGKDSLATALLQTTYRPDLNYQFIFNDTGCELPPVYAWLDRIEEKTGWKIERIGESLEARIRAYRGFLPSPRARYCTIETKIQPTEQWLDGDAATIYYGLRADEQRTGYVPVANSRIVPRYPLRPAPEGIAPNGVDLQGVYAILEAQDLLPPTFFWERLYAAVCDRLADLDWQNKLNRWEFNTLFSGRTRANCYFCFYQRKYEEVWLLETYPDLFWRMASFEVVKEDRPKAKRSRRNTQLVLLEVDEQPTTKAYTWRREYSKEELAGNSVLQNQIFEDRVKAVCTYIHAKVARQALGLVVDNEIAATSCGLLCGK